MVGHMSEPAGAWQIYEHFGREDSHESIDLAEVQAWHRSGYFVKTIWSEIGGRYEPVDIQFVPPKGRAVTTGDLQRLPIGAMLSEARERLASSARLVQQISTWIGERPVHPALLRSGPHRGRRLGPSELESVAAVYRQAWGAGLPVNEAVRDAFTLSKDGAAKRILAARQAGLLDGIGPKR
jgi:hypothetical protein